MGDARPGKAIDLEANRRLNGQEYDRGEAVLRSLPTRAWVSVAGRCNLLCTHCPRSIVEEELLSAVEMDASLLARVTGEVLPSVEVCRVGGNNLGEQLIARGWDGFAAALEGLPLEPWLITNGQLMNPGRVAHVVARGYVVDVSIDGATEESYGRIRGASLERLKANVRAIAAERDRRQREAEGGQGRRCRLVFSFTAFRENVEELPALVELAAELGVDQVTVTHFMPSLEEQRFQSLYYHQGLANRLFDEARDRARELGVVLELPPKYPERSLSEVGALNPRVRSRRSPPGGGGEAGAERPCRHPWSSVSINEKGEVFPCCQSNLLLGDLRESSFDEIWNGPRYQRLRETVNTPRALPDCQCCVLRGEGFTSVECADGSYFLRNIEVAKRHRAPLRRRLRELCARSAFGRWAWSRLRHVYKSFLEWHPVTR